MCDLFIGLGLFYADVYIEGTLIFRMNRCGDTEIYRYGIVQKKGESTWK